MPQSLAKLSKDDKIIISSTSSDAIFHPRCMVYTVLMNRFGRLYLRDTGGIDYIVASDCITFETIPSLQENDHVW